MENTEGMTRRREQEIKDGWRKKRSREVGGRRLRRGKKEKREGGRVREKGKRRRDEGRKEGGEGREKACWLVVCMCVYVCVCV